MTLKLIGSAFIIISCGVFGFMIAAAHAREVKTIKTLINCLDYMEWELEYKMTCLPDLCRQVTNQCSGVLKSIFNDLAGLFDAGSEPNAQRCMELILSDKKDVPTYTKTALYQLGRTLGKFDLEGQIKGIKAVKEECRRNLEQLQCDHAVRIRTYKTLGLCAGAAMAIILF